MMLIDEINQRIKQRPPFQMIERVLELEPNKSAKGLKNVSVNEPYFQGHFPGTPIMPGVLIVEASAQLCSLVFDASGTKEDELNVLLKVDGFKFLKPVIPGDQLIITVTKTKEIGPLVTLDCKVEVESQVFAKGSLTFTKIPKDSVYSR